LPKISGKYKFTVDGILQKGSVDGNFVKTECGSGKHRFVIEKI
jgi:hypothetical protein